MSHSEYLEWLEFLSLPTEQEIQLAQIAYMIGSYIGIKDINLNSFLINKIDDLEDVNSRELTEDDINRLAGVKSD